MHVDPLGRSVVGAHHSERVASVFRVLLGTSGQLQRANCKMNMNVRDPLPQETDQLTFIGLLREHSQCFGLAQKVTLTGNEGGWTVRDRRRGLLKFEKGEGKHVDIRDVLQSMNMT